MKDIRIPEVKAIVSIDGERMGFISLKISQRMSQHHDFELVIDHKTFDDKFFDAPEKKLALVNTKVVIDLQNGDNISKAYVFSGLITSVRMLAQEGEHGFILLKGKSNTIELERGKICQTYSNTNLYTIINEITEGIVNLSVINKPDWKSDIAFAIQYKENDWNFMSRILHQYNVAYHYNGLDLVIGQYPEYPTVELTYDLDLNSLEVCSLLLPNEESNYFYRGENHSTIRQDSPKEIEEANFYLQQVSRQADRLTRERKPNTPIEAHVPDMDSLINQMNRKKVATGAEMMYIKGRVKCPDVLIGRLVNIKLPKPMGGTEIGTYRVYAVTHEIDQNGRYVCDFQAVPARLKYLPTPEVKIPVVNPILVECWSNEDPLGIGRVKVKFPFDERPCDHWIPVMTYDGGGDPKGFVKFNRGSVWIPEVGDSSLAYFLNGAELSQPFIMGSMFHGENADKQGGGKGNHLKSFRDKSGSYFVMNSADASIELRSMKTNNTITLNKDGEIHITSPEKLVLTSQNIEINATNDLFINSGNKMIINAVSGIYTFTSLIKQTVEKYFNLFTNNVLISTKEDINLESKLVNAIGTEKLFLHSDKLLHANSTGVMDLKSEGMLTQAQSAKQVALKPTEVIASAIVEFRPLSAYDGEFGFDWLRIDEGSLNYETDYKTLIVSGYFPLPNASGSYEYLTKDIAYSFLTLRYKNIPIIKAFGVLAITADKYYIPWLNLYTKNKHDSVKNGTKPPYQADLRVLVHIFENLDALEFDYDNKLFDVVPKSLNDLTPTLFKKQSSNVQVKISCISNEDGFNNDKEINVWAYPKGLKAKSIPEQIAGRKLAGRIYVCKNSKPNRISQKFILINCRTKITTSDNLGSVSQFDKDVTRKFCYQALIHAEFVNGGTLDLRNDAAFKIVGGTYGTYIYRNTHGYTNVSDGHIFQDGTSIPTMFQYLKGLFEAKNPAYRTGSHIYIFAFDEEPYDLDTSTTPATTCTGQVESIGVRNVVLFASAGGGTLVHEAFHALGLYHSFSDGTFTQTESNRKFTYPQGDTENIMDYSSKSTYTWKWQWDSLH